MNVSEPIREYALKQVNDLLTKLAFRVHRVSIKPGPDEIHDLRVSIRRFSQGLAVFREFFPSWEIKKVNKRLKRMMKLTSQIRDRDITLEFLNEMDDDTHRLRFERERAAYIRDLSEMVRRWSARDYSAKWRSSLSLHRV